MAQSGTPSSATSVGNQETPTVTVGEELGDGQLSITAPLEPPCIVGSKIVPHPHVNHLSLLTTRRKVLIRECEDLSS